MAKKWNKQEFVGKYKIEAKNIDIDGQELTIRTLNAEEYFSLQDGIEDGKPNQNYYLKLIYMSVIDDNGAPFFSMQEIRTLPGSVINKILVGISALNGMDIQANKADLKN